MNKKNGVNYSMLPEARARRNSALIRLENQLKSGKKTEKKTGLQISLTQGDIKRIEKEIAVLLTRI